MATARDVKFKGRPVTAHEIVDAIGKYKGPPGGKTYALWYKKESYPPKEILALATGHGVDSFGGGEQAHRVFRALGFKISFAPTGRQDNGNIDAARELKAKEKELFFKKWKNLRTKDLKKTDNRPGVYVLACRPNQLEGKRVTTENIFYVGMSKYAGVNKRLRQFLGAASGKGGHNAGTRFYKKYRRHGIYRNANFYFATASYCCEMGKSRRSTNDLRKMGIVAALEMFVMARVKKETGSEPELNSQ
jgi:hypothetical protein